MLEYKATPDDRSTPLHVALAGGHAPTRCALRELLNEQPTLSVVRAVQTLDELLEADAEVAPELVLLDIQLPDSGAVLQARDFSRQLPESRVVLHSMQANAQAVVAAVIAGTSGHVVKTLDGSSIAQRLSVLHRREWPDRRIGSGLVGWYETRLAGGRPGFTAHDYLLLQLIAEGYTDPEIASQLDLAPVSFRRELERFYATLTSRPDLRGLGAQLAPLLVR